MKLIPLIDRAGHVRAWADRSTGWISNLNGKIFALIEFDGVFKAQAIAKQIGWSGGDHLRDNSVEWSWLDRVRKLKGSLCPAHTRSLRRRGCVCL